MVFISAVFLTLVCGATPLEWWDMNDASGTILKNLANSGTYGSPFAGGLAALGTTDGSGHFVVAGNGGKTTQKAPKAGSTYADSVNPVYASPLTTGSYSLDVNFASWNWNTASEGDLWKFKAQDSSGVDIAGIELGIVGGAGRIRMWTMGASNTYYRSYAVDLVSTTGAAAQVFFDFDANTVSYVLNGVTQFSAADFVGSNLGLMVYTTAGDGVNDWVTAASNIKIDSMGINVIPEPATVGMLGLGALVAMLVRRLGVRW